MTTDHAKLLDTASRTYGEKRLTLVADISNLAQRLDSLRRNLATLDADYILLLEAEVYRQNAKVTK